ncbi:hypothetical protein ACN27F_10395 [Solwaraspora sp. WMMB335]|uniref:hypothetical protein n=1 Tax=Solwaraspora sp. WMMB335 TaxID=3404118 RepID=UPI003B961488
MDFFSTPLIVDVLLAAKDGRAPRQCPTLSTYGDAIDTAISALASTGAVTQVASPNPTAEPSLRLTHKGRRLCDLVEEIIGLGTSNRSA